MNFKNRLILAAYVLGAKFTQNVQAADPTVTISPGVVVGSQTRVVSAAQETVQVNQYLGIPFAAPPTGSRRFAPPEPTSWNGPIEAQSLPPACMQQILYPKNVHDFVKAVFNSPFGPPPPENEDCLYLNVYAPESASQTNKKPVMFWIYGGNLQFGSSAVLFYDGSFYAGLQDILVVTFNYRTNIFGFPGDPSIETGQHNVGLLDQRLALQWVRDNIAQFGGDPERVTIFGESAGAESVKQLLALPPKPLQFGAAILESVGAFLPGVPADSFLNTAKEFGCANADSSIDCLRKVPAEQLKDYITKNNVFFPPADDELTYTSDVRPSIRNKEFADVPILIDSNADEGRVFAAAAGFTDASSTVGDVIDLLFPNNSGFGSALAELYMPMFNDVYLFASEVITSLIFTCTTSLLANFATQNGLQVWRYYFSFVSPTLAVFPDAGAFHSAEIPFVFGSFAALPNVTATDEELRLSRYMQTTWADFAKEPSAGPGWEKVGSQTHLTLAEIGGEGNSTGRTMILPQSVDFGCFLYEPVISLQGY